MNKRLRRIEIRTLVISVVVIIAMTASFLSLFVRRTNRSIRKNLADMMAANGQQLEMNVDNYLDTVENTVRLMFRNENYTRFDPTDPALSDYERVKTEDDISEYISNLGSVMNFSDFGIVYANDEKVGYISQTTAALYPDGGLYDYLSGFIDDKAEKNGWTSQGIDVFGRLVYVKELNAHALILASVYSLELTSVFRFSDSLNGVTACLTDEDGKVLFSSDADAQGRAMSADILAPVRESSRDAIGVDDKYFTAVNTLHNGWKVYCYAPVDVLMEESLGDTRSLLWLTFILASFFVVAFILLTRIIAEPMNGMVDTLEARAENDGLTGVFNKVTFERLAAEACGNVSENGYIALLMLDIDKFKDVNDRYGHARGDEVLRENGQVMKRYLRGASAIGRVGGDEFAACYVLPPGEADEICRAMSGDIEEYRTAFHGVMMAKNIEATTSMGIIISQVPGQEFSHYYHNADRALYESKRSGRNRVTWFREDAGGVEMMHIS